MGKFLTGLGLALGGGLLYAIYAYPGVGIFVLAGGMFLFGVIIGGGIGLLYNKQWTTALGQMGFSTPRVNHNIKYPDYPALPQYPAGPQLGPGQVSDPWDRVEIIEVGADDGRPVA